MILTPTRPYKYEIGQSIKGKNERVLVVLDREVRFDKDGHKLKWYKTKCEDCSWEENWVKEYDLNKKLMPCGCCHGKTVVCGINDIATTADWMLQFLQNPEDGKRYTKHSLKSVRVKCPTCGREKDYSPHAIANNKGICCRCGDGVSFPEKVMDAILSQTSFEYVSEYSPKWGLGKIYDFYIPSLNMIIETHGKQHYNIPPRHPKWKTYEEEHENDLLKFDLSVINGIEHYIVLDCCESDFSHIKAQIENSVLSEALTLDKIDWCSVMKQASKNIKFEVCKAKNENPNLTVKQLQEIFGLCQKTILNYLNDGTKMGWCHYDGQEVMQSLYNRNKPKKTSLNLELK